MLVGFTVGEPVAKAVPPVLVVYQAVVWPLPTVADSVADPPLHMGFVSAVGLVGVLGSVLTVTATEAAAEFAEQSVESSYRP